MHPILFRLPNGFPIGTYGVLIVIGLLLAIFLGTRLARRIGLRADYVYDLTFVMLVAGFIGARVLYIIVEWETFRQAPGAIIFSRTGFVFQGGLVGALIAGVIYCRWHKLPLMEIADLGTPALALGHAIGRIGCFLAGCCYGLSITPHLHESALARVGVTYPIVHEPDGQISPMFNQVYHEQIEQHLIAPDASAPLPIVPVQLFETVGNLVICAVLLLIWKRRRFSGQVGGSYLVLYGVLRFGLEFLRGDEARGRWFGDSLSTGQVISLAMIAGGVAIYVWGLGTRARLVTLPAEVGEAAAQAKDDTVAPRHSGTKA